MNLHTDISGSSHAAGPEQALGFAGMLSPQAAWSLAQKGEARILDVRTIEERSYVGRVPDTLHVAWATGTAMTRNPHFVRQVQQLVPDRDAALILLCRSGKRSAAAAEALTKAGYSQVFNIAEGFEGDLNAEGHRGTQDGWRFHGLPWQQD